MEANKKSHDVIGGFGDKDGLPSDISELIARRGRSKQSFLGVNLGCGWGQASL